LLCYARAVQVQAPVVARLYVSFMAITASRNRMQSSYRYDANRPCRGNSGVLGWVGRLELLVHGAFARMEPDIRLIQILVGVASTKACAYLYGTPVLARAPNRGRWTPSQPLSLPAPAPALATHNRKRPSPVGLDLRTACHPALPQRRHPPPTCAASIDACRPIDLAQRAHRHQERSNGCCREEEASTTVLLTRS